MYVSFPASFIFAASLIISSFGRPTSLNPHFFAGRSLQDSNTSSAFFTVISLLVNIMMISGFMYVPPKLCYLLLSLFVSSLYLRNHRFAIVFHRLLSFLSIYTIIFIFFFAFLLYFNCLSSFYSFYRIAFSSFCCYNDDKESFR